MYEIKVKNEVNGREYAAKFEDKAEKDAWLDKHINKETWGKNQRQIVRENVEADLESRIISLENKVHYETDEQGEEVEVSVEYANIKSDYVVTEKNLNLSKKYRNEKKLEQRKKEYPSIEKVLHIILDHGLESQEFADLQASRQATKAKYPTE